MIFILYRLVTALATPVFWLWRIFQRGDERNKWRERFARELPPCDLWLHAASVGEIQLLGPLIRQLIDQRPTLRIQLTAMTLAGVARGRELYGVDCRVSFCPLDFPLVISHALDQMQPKLVGIAETEIWPNLLAGCARRGIPTVLINGRMSVRAARGYGFIRRAVGGILNHHGRLFVRSDADREQFLVFGISPDKISLAGDLKFDAPVSVLPSMLRNENRERLGLLPEHFFLVAGSTRPGEEDILFSCYDDIRKRSGSLRLLLAPRHLDRVEEVITLIQHHGYGVRTVDHLPESGDARVTPVAPGEILLVTKMGLLNSLYQLADLAVVGGTFAPIGGHNLLEPVWAGAPVLFGPSTFNVNDAAEFIVSHGYGEMTANADELARAIEQTIAQPDRFARHHGSAAAGSASQQIAAYILERIRP